MGKASWVLLTFLVLTVIGVWYAVVAESRTILTVAFLNVGQGDAVFIASPTGTQVLIDSGPSREVLRELGKVMPFYDRTLDLIVATHPDKDHIGGFPEILKRFDVDFIVESGAQADTGVFEALEDGILHEDAERVSAQRGQRIDLGGGAVIDVFFPDRDVSGLESNAASIVLRLVYGETEFLFTGDSPAAIEMYLASTYQDSLKSDVLKVGHHGSRTSSSGVFVGRTDPEYAVISRGCDNRYGHPHDEVIDTLHGFEIEILDTCEDGRIVFESDGFTLRLKK